MRRPGPTPPSLLTINQASLPVALLPYPPGYIRPGVISEALVTAPAVPGAQTRDVAGHAE